LEHVPALLAQPGDRRKSHDFHQEGPKLPL
jgi:hypothetical protein